MLDFAPKSKSVHQIKTVQPAISNQSYLQNSAEALNAGLTDRRSFRNGHDFGQIPIFPAEHTDFNGRGSDVKLSGIIQRQPIGEPIETETDALEDEGGSVVPMHPLDNHEIEQLEEFVKQHSVYPHLQNTKLIRNFAYDTMVAGEFFFCNRNPKAPFDRFCMMTGNVRDMECFLKFLNKVVRPAFGRLSPKSWYRKDFGWLRPGVYYRPNFKYRRYAMKGQTFNEFKDSLKDRLTDPETKQTRAMSSFGGGWRKKEISMPQMEKIYPDWAKPGEDEKTEKQTEERKERDLALLNQAFDLMQLDTLEAQAIYLAHASGESGQFRVWTATGDPPSLGQWIGRGPLQVTTKVNYVATLAYLQIRAEELMAAGDYQNAAVVADAYYSISQDVTAAADANYAFMYSAAFMRAALHARQEEEKIQDISGIPSFYGNRVESLFMTGGARDKYNDYKKRDAYVRAMRELGKDVDLYEPGAPEKEEG